MVLQLTVADVMTQPVLTVTPDTPLQQAVQMISNHQAQPCQPNCRARISGKPATARATVSPLAIERKDRNNAQNVRS